MIIIVKNRARLKIPPKLIKKVRINQAKVFFVIIILVLAALPSYYFYNQYQQTQKLLQNPTQATDAITQNLVNAVGKLMVLPANEKPTVATVSDITKLVGQPFFANAQNGDKVLIYTQSKKAILYRESINKIIEVAPVSLGQSAQNPSTPTTTPTPVAPR